MKIKQSTWRRVGMGGLLVAGLAVAMPAVAQPSDSRGSGDRQGMVTADELRSRIESCPSLDAGQRGAMLGNLEEVLRLGASPVEIEPAFPRHGGELGIDPSAMVRIQDRVRDMLSDGLPPQLLLDKLREGEVKGVPAPMLERAVVQMENNVRRAHRFLSEMPSVGGNHEVDPQHQQMLERHLALNMWSGLEEGDLDHLLDRSRMRETACAPSDLVSATDVLTIARQRGMDRDQALDLVGDAIESGYTHQEMRTLGAMMAATEMDQHGDQVRDHLRQGMDHHRDFAEMADEMMSWGWMGPADMDRNGGWHSMMDDWLGGGPGDHGAVGDHDHMGGDGGMGGSGGSGNGGMGGGGSGDGGMGGH